MYFVPQTLKSGYGPGPSWWQVNIFNI